MWYNTSMKKLINTKDLQVNKYTEEVFHNEKSIGDLIDLELVNKNKELFVIL